MEASGLTRTASDNTPDLNTTLTSVPLPCSAGEDEHWTERTLGSRWEPKGGDAFGLSPRNQGVQADSGPAPYKVTLVSEAAHPVCWAAANQ